MFYRATSSISPTHPPEHDLQRQAEHGVREEHSLLAKPEGRLSEQETPCCQSAYVLMGVRVSGRLSPRIILISMLTVKRAGNVTHVRKLQSDGYRGQYTPLRQRVHPWIVPDLSSPLLETPQPSRLP